eukprot:TRINITY_DN5087_c0_g4_i1.p1 TRINITY_DN5087_c0_g4~~TRINITY_DN5087_c0_g4_i1.p1  ORF type:complete len:152 (+),score=15.15 TRINITY_DN5087_c0_g4_i1:216-671(+)
MFVAATITIRSSKFINMNQFIVSSTVNVDGGFYDGVFINWGTMTLTGQLNYSSKASFQSCTSSSIDFQLDTGSPEIIFNTDSIPRFEDTNLNISITGSSHSSATTLITFIGSINNAYYQGNIFVICPFSCFSCVSLAIPSFIVIDSAIGMV